MSSKTEEPTVVQRLRSIVSAGNARISMQCFTPDEQQIIRAIPKGLRAVNVLADVEKPTHAFGAGWTKNRAAGYLIRAGVGIGWLDKVYGVTESDVKAVNLS